MTRVLILCTGNSCRSQIAEGYIRYFGGEGLEVYSAGIETHGVNPKAISIMKEMHYNFKDPAKATGNEEEIMQQFREVRDEIKAYCREFVSII
jgi:arsenate reductase